MPLFTSCASRPSFAGHRQSLAPKLYAPQGCSSLFTYCVQVLHFSEHAAYLRIEAARAARRFPVILDQLADGSLHLTAINRDSVRTESHHRLAAGVSAYNPSVLDTHVSHARHTSRRL